MKTKKIIAVRDIVADTTPFIGMGSNEAQFVRDTLPIIINSMRLPLKDIQFQYVGEYDDETGTITPAAQMKVIPQDIYKYEPETEAEKLDEKTETKLKNTIEKA